MNRNFYFKSQVAGRINPDYLRGSFLNLATHAAMPTLGRMSLGEVLGASITLSTLAFVAGSSKICNIRRTPTAMSFDVVYYSSQAVQ